MDILSNYEYNQAEPLARPHNQKGVFNAYYKAMKKDSNTEVLLSKFQQPLYERLLIKQKRLLKLKQIRHQNIVEIYDVLLDKTTKTLYVALEWCPGDSLYEYQKSQSYFDFEVTTKILCELAEGLQAIHELSELHRHINMVNVQFSSQGQAKLSFRCLYPKTIYLSPEEKQGTKAKQNEIFSLGILVFKLLFNAVPFEGKSLEEEKYNVKKGVNFMINEKEMFPIVVPTFLRKLLIGMLASNPADRPSCEQILTACQDRYNEECTIPKNIRNKIFVNGLISLFTRSSFEDETIILALEPKKKQLKKVTIFKAKKSSLQTYVNQKFKNYVQVQEMIGIVPIEKYKILEDQYLVIQTFYDNQGNLKFYMQNEGEINKKRIDEFINKLVQKMRAFGKSHNYLTNECVILRRGNFYINYPPIMTEQYADRVKADKELMMMIAPEVMEGKSSTNADGWSVAILRYKLSNGDLPKLDANGNPKIPRQANLTLEQRQFYNDFLVADPIKREDIKETIEQRTRRKQTEQRQKDLLQLKLREQEERQRRRKAQLDAKKKIQEKEKQDKIDHIKKLAKIKRQAEEDERRKLEAKKKEQQERKDKEQREKKRRDQQLANARASAILGAQKKQQQKTCGQSLAQKSQIFQGLQKHWTKPIRVGLKCLLGLIMLIFLYYWQFFLINGQLIAEHSIYETKVVYIRAFKQDSTPDIEYNLVTKTPTETYNQFYNTTLDVLRDDYHCVLNDYSVDSDVVDIINKTGFTVYQIFGVLLAVINLLIFCVSLAKMDYPKIYFLSRFEENDFTMLWNWMFINMALATQISFSYLLYGSLFHMKLEPCLEKATLTAVQFLLKDWVSSFNIRFIWIYIGLVFSYLVIIFFIAKPQYISHKYLKAALIGLYLAGVFCRIMGGSGDHVAWEKQSVFGKIGQLLLLIICITFFVIDLLFGCRVSGEDGDSDKNNKVNDQSRGQINDTEMMLED